MNRRLSVPLVTGILGCTTTMSPVELSHADLPTMRLGRQLLTDTAALALPATVSVTGNYIVILDLMADSVAHVLDRERGTYLRAIGHRGAGPGEFISPESLVPLGGARGVAIYDFDLRRITQWAPDRMAGLSRAPSSTHHVDPPGALYGLIPRADGYFALGMLPEGRVHLLDDTGHRRSHLGDIPGDRGIPAALRQHAFQSRLVARPDGHRLAVLERHSGHLTVLDVLTGRERRRPGPFAFDPRIELGRLGRDRVFRQADDLRFGYVGAAADGDYIYGLFSGRLNGELGARAVHARFVHRFDWDGTFIDALQLADEIVAMALDERGHGLIGVRHLPSPAVIRYALPPAVTAPPHRAVTGAAAPPRISEPAPGRRR